MDPEPSKFQTRKKFLKALMGELVVLYDEAKGKRQVPLNRIHELPERIICEIKPVMFDGPDWKIKDDKLFHLNNIDKKYYVHKQFCKSELTIIQYFNQDLTLSEISNKVSVAMNLEIADAYMLVRGLFFEMALLLVCHPLEQYDFDKISQKQTE